MDHGKPWFVEQVSSPGETFQPGFEHMTTYAQILVVHVQWKLYIQPKTFHSVPY